MKMPFKPRQAALALALTLAAGVAGAVPGYVTDVQTGAVVDSSGNCWRSGDWTADKAASPCDAVARAATPAAPITQAPPPPAPIAAAPAAPPKVIEKVTLSSDVLFDFNKAELVPAGQRKLDELVTTAKGAEVQQVVIVGHADRIGSDQYNAQLSERRAQAVRDYFGQKGVDQQRVKAEGHGEREPVTGNQCAKMGPEKGSNKKLVACLAPDRRVEIEVLGQRESVATSTPSDTPSSGASSSATVPAAK